MQLLWICIALILSFSPRLSAQTDNTDTRPSAQPQTTVQQGTRSSPGTVPTTAVREADANGNSTRLVLVKIQKAVYPIEAMQQEIQGKVIIHLLISESGEVEKAERVSGNDILAASAIDAMKKWRFKPYLKDGHPVKVSTNMAYDFAFRDKVKDTAPPDAVVASLPGTALTPNKPANEPSSGNPPAPPASSVAKPTQVRVSTAVSQGMLIHRVQPIYPKQARANHVQGTVVLEAVIAKDGRLKNLKAVSGPDELQGAAIGAVEQWRYRPYLIQGEPVDVHTTIHVNFALSGF